MNIIKQGTIPVKLPPWWQTVVHTCPMCGAEWTLDDGDTPNILVATERSPKGESTCVSVCPTCHNSVQTIRSQSLPPGPDNLITCTPYPVVAKKESAS